MRRCLPAAFLVLALLIAAPAHAKQSYLNAVKIGAGCDYGFVPTGRMDNNDTLDDAEFLNSSLVGVRGAVSIKISSGKHAFFGLGGTYRGARGTIDLDYDMLGEVSNNNIWINNTSIEFFVGWDFLTRSLRPYALGGMGYSFSSIRIIEKGRDNEETALNGNNLPFFIATGLDYMVKDRVSIGGELRGEYIYNLVQYGTGDVEIRADYIPIAALFHVGIYF